MAANLNKLLKLTMFEVDPSSLKVAKQLQHCLQMLTDIVLKYYQIPRSQNADVVDKLQMISAYVIADVYEMIEDCADCGTLKTQKHLIMSPSAIFTSRALASRKQNPK